ncbi:BTB domain-containing protein [Mycena kentingensis (nom. inval.)]|nr:BTB domain-containing protein [Mycena kentingensis (nom. inval.)]
MSISERSEELWFSDGNIVLEAGHRQFKVFHGILGARSTIFRDMLAMPQPPNREMADGCPLVKLPDAAEDMTAFLKAIYDSSFFLPYPSPVDIDVVLGILAVSDKYDVPDLRRRALVHLSSGFPTTLAGRDLQASNPPPLERPSWRTVSQHAVNLMPRIVYLARFLAPWILPMALYRISGYQADEVYQSVLAVFDRNAEFAFTEEQARTFLAGHTSLVRETTSSTIAAYTSPPSVDGCLTPENCLLRRITILDLVQRFLVQTPSHFTLWGLHETNVEALLPQLCAICAPELQATHKAARQSLWDRVPGMFSLPPWSELEQLKLEALGSTPF